MTTDIAPAVLSVNEAATYLHSNPKDIYVLLKAGELAGWRTAGGHWRVSVAACDEWIRKQEGRL